MPSYQAKLVGREELAEGTLGEQEDLEPRNGNFRLLATMTE